MHLTDDKKIWIPDGDNWCIWGADFEKGEFAEVIDHHITKWRVALDVGAHVGIWSMRLAERFKEVYAFEPVPKHIECWKQNMLQWKDTSILYEVALGHKNGTIEIQVPVEENTGMAAIVQPQLVQTSGWDDLNNFPKIEVETRTLDSYEFDQVDFIKIDVEWFELKVLQGAENTIRKHKPVIYVEINDIGVYDFMENLDIDYRIFYATSSKAHGNSLFKIDHNFNKLMKPFSPTPATRHALTKLRLSNLYDKEVY